MTGYYTKCDHSSSVGLRIWPVSVKVLSSLGHKSLDGEVKATGQVFIMGRGFTCLQTCLVTLT